MNVLLSLLFAVPLYHSAGMNSFFMLQFSFAFLGTVCALLLYHNCDYESVREDTETFKELHVLFGIQKLFQSMNLIPWFQIPRTIVNVVQILYMKPLREVQRPTLGCQLQKSPVFSSSSSSVCFFNSQ